jgi:hypothetical protein
MAALCLVPQFIIMASPSFLPGHAVRIVTPVLAMNPATLVRLVEEMPTEFYRGQYGISPAVYPWLFCAAITGYFALGVGLRQRCLKNADELLGRSWTKEDESVATAAERDLETDAVWIDPEPAGPAVARATG